MILNSVFYENGFVKKENSFWHNIGEYYVAVPVCVGQVANPLPKVSVVKFGNY